MYKAAREFETEIAPQFLLDAVWDVARYPEFVKGLKAVEVEQDDGTRATAWFTASLAGMDFRYLLEIERNGRAVSWRRLAGSFKDAAGAMIWLGERRFRYENAMDPGFAVPELAVRLVLERSLPRLVREFQERAQLLERASSA
jgi:uncharacterized membrane protein